MIPSAIFVGVVATVAMDLAAFAQRRLFGIPSLNYAMVGRWLCHIPRGVLIHRPIGESTPVPGEAALGWTAHYLIGIQFAAAFLSLVGEDWMRNPEPIRPLIFGLASAVVPILLLQPCMGQALPHGEPLHHGAPAPEACRPTSRSGSACGSAVCCWSWPERDGESLRPVRKPSAGCFAWPRPC